MTTPNLLLVVPNPFVFIGSEGLPMGYCAKDPTKSRPYQMVGAQLTKTAVEHDDAPQDPKQRRPDDLRDQRVRVTPAFSMKAHRVENTEYHKSRILCGDLIAADPTTWKTVGGKPKDFLQPAMVLAATRDQRVHEWMAEHDGEEPPCAAFSIVQHGEGEALTVDFVTPGPDGAIEAGEVKDGLPVHVAAVFRESKPEKPDAKKADPDARKSDRKLSADTKKTHTPPTA